MKAFINIVFYLIVLSTASSAIAQTDEITTEFHAATEEFIHAGLPGPRNVAIFDEATLSLPAGYAFVPEAPTARLLRSMGQRVDDKKLVGAIVPMRDGDYWAAFVRFTKDGHIRDDDAQHWKAEDLLQRLTDNVNQSNPGRKGHGFPELEVRGWAEAPVYDAATHRLAWAAAVHAKGDPDDDAHNTASYQTEALGRDGYLELMVTSRLAELADGKSINRALVADIEYAPGKRYEDFDKLTDHVAAYGLAALIVGVAAKKLGLIAVLLAFLAKFTKLGVFISVIVAAVVRRFKKRKALPDEKKPRDPPR